MRIGNWPLVMLVLEHVIKHPDEYYQGNWGQRRECGTTRCIAGWLAFFAGYRDYEERWPTKLILRVTDPLAPTRPLSVERAALDAMELTPETYGVIPLTEPDDDEDEHDLWEEAEELASELFSGGMAFSSILETFYELAQRDGVTFTPLIQAELMNQGVIAA